MRPLEELAFIRDRVLAEIRANPSVRPYLDEEGRAKPGPRPERDEAVLEARRQRRAAYKRRWDRERRP